MSFETKEPITLSEEMAKAFGFAEADTEQVEVTEEVAPVQEVVEAEVSTEAVQEEAPVQEQQEEIEIPEISTQVVEQAPEQVEKENKKGSPVKIKAYNTALVAALNKYVASVENPDELAFIRAYKASYDNISPLEIIRREVISNIPIKDARPSVIEKKVQQKLIELGVDLDSDDPEDLADSEQILQIAAEMAKGRMIQSGKEFVSQFESDLEIEVDAFEAPVEEQVDEAALQAEREAKKQLYVAEFSKVIQNGVIQVTDTASGTVINIPVPDTGVIAEAAADPVGFITSKFLNPDGTVNYAKFAQFVNYSNNEDAVHSAWFKHGYTQATNKVTSQLKNKVDIGQPRPTEIQTEMTPFTHPLEFLQGAKVIRGGN